jgi:hypothetical protein
MMRTSDEPKYSCLASYSVSEGTDELSELESIACKYKLDTNTMDSTIGTYDNIIQELLDKNMV